MNNKVNVDDIFKAGKGILKFFNLLDRNNHLSITNIAVIVCITKLALIPQASIVDIGALLISLMNYSHKRVESNKTAQTEAINNETVATLTKEIEQVKSLHESVSKQAQETQKVLKNANLMAAFGNKKA